MSEMKVGDWGVLQNCKHVPWNGLNAEIIGPLALRSVHSIKKNTIREELTYQVNISGDPPPRPGDKWNVRKHEIRPITDPDAEQETEKVKELVE